MAGRATDSPGEDVRRLLDRLVRRERGRLTADLVRRLGPARLDVAEDMVQEAVASALQAWSYSGLPANPQAWLTRVARNKAFDRLRREKWEVPYCEHDDTRSVEGSATLFAARVDDPEIRLVLLCCNSALGELDRLALTLNIASGFTARDIAKLFLAPETAIAQRLARAKRKLRGEEGTIADAPSVFEISARLPTVLKVVYLMFSLGYAPSSGESVVRRDTAEEALRLARVLADQELTAAAEAKALAALLCFQASRFDARETPAGEIVLLRDQDRGAWNQRLIADGVGYLERAKKAARLSRYHLEAGIAAIHALAPRWEDCDWSAIVRLYRHLETLTASPVVCVNACVAVAMSGEPESALAALDRLADRRDLQAYAPYFIARGEVLRELGRPADAADSFARALTCTVTAPTRRLLRRRLEGDSSS